MISRSVADRDVKITKDELNEVENVSEMLDIALQQYVNIGTVTVMVPKQRTSLRPLPATFSKALSLAVQLETDVCCRSANPKAVIWKWRFQNCKQINAGSIVKNLSVGRVNQVGHKKKICPTRGCCGPVKAL